jgi:uncharacterized protein YqfA (UPF0365 family)
MIILSIEAGIVIVVLVVLILVILSVLLGVLACMRPWLRARLGGGSDVQVAHVIGMRLRGNPAMLLVDAYLKLLHSGKQTTIQMVESCYIANKGRVLDVDTLVMLVPRFEEEIKKKKSD